jgi:RNA polymerase subunit RPABC4/transcription elongation factor Spt4
VPLQACPECDHEVSESALACPNCAHPFAVAGAQVCPYCQKPTLMKMQGLYGAKEILIALVLLAFFIIPGLAYYFDVSKQPRCSNCKRRVSKPVPVG